ncbi:MAG: TIGR01459 family HAD-type hydrolase [Alphaproteobacteria bacterium]
MTKPIPLIDGIGALASSYQAVIIDLWGVIHDGVKLYPGVADTLRALSDAAIPYAMLTNAPRRADAIGAMMDRMGLAPDLRPHVMSSGEATFLGLKDRRDDWYDGTGRRYLHIGPGRDRGLFEGLEVEQAADVADAGLIVNTGPWEDNETVADYEEQLAEGARRGLKMVCANPDLEVIRGGTRIICAGALAKRYEELGGDVLYYGKPYPPIYRMCLAQLGGPPPDRVLAIGDSLLTDIAGATAMGMDSLLVIGGIHGEEMTSGTADRAIIERRVSAACAEAGQAPVAAISSFVWQ